MKYNSLIGLIFVSGLSLVLALSIGCKKDKLPDLDFRQEMRDFVVSISEYANRKAPGFIIIPQNGIELITANGEETGLLETLYLQAIDGHGQEDLFYGYAEDDMASPADETAYLRSFLDRSKEAGKKILVTDYCSSPEKIDDSYSRNHAAGYVSFAASHRELDHIPDYPLSVFKENAGQVDDLSGVKNFLYLINNAGFNSKEAFIDAVTSTNYDLLIMDLFFNDNTAFTTEEVSLLRNKANGGTRLILCYLSIGEAEDYRYYWQQGWKPGNPSWLDDENPGWGGNYKVRYWDAEWQEIIFGNTDSYLDKIIGEGFDGAYLDIIDAYEYFE